MAKQSQPMPDDDIAVGASADENFSTLYEPGTPEGQAERIAQENAAKAQSYPVLGDIFDWFDDQIKRCPNISNIVTDSQEINGVTYARQVSIEAQVLAYQLLQSLLEEKRDEFREFQVER